MIFFKTLTHNMGHDYMRRRTLETTVFRSISVQTFSNNHVNPISKVSEKRIYGKCLSLPKLHIKPL